MEKIISIVIPTFNRCDYLKDTIDSFESQVLRHVHEVEMIVCDNASDDNTPRFIDAYSKKKSFFSAVFYTERVLVKESFERTISNATGRFVLLWGDDDIPHPYLLDYLLDMIKQHPMVQLYHFNRMIGYDDDGTFKSLFVCDRTYEKEVCEYAIKTFLAKYFHEASFMSSVMFARKAWMEGLKVSNGEFYGYEHLHPIYYGCRKSNVIYISSPLCIQRKHKKRSWGELWPKFGMLGIPNLLWALQEERIIDNAKQIWNNRFNCFSQFMYNILWASCYKKTYFSLRHELYRYQDGIVRKIIIFLSLTIIPSFVFRMLKSVYFNIKQQ